MSRHFIAASLLLMLSACAADPPEQPASEWPAFEAAQSAAPESGSAPMPRACELVSAAQAQDVLGAEAGLMADDDEACLWAGAEGVGKMAMLTLTVIDGGSEAEAKTLFNSLAGLPSRLGSQVNEAIDEKTRKSGQELEGLGDEAAISGSSFGGGFGDHGVGAQMLVVRKGTRLVSINVTGTTRMDGLSQRMQALARDAVAKL